ncbi:MAG: ATP-binding protein [Thaumarchaeota archaeon]|nr:ATP-binding protein [Nitrososphaerota archaeon]
MVEEQKAIGYVNFDGGTTDSNELEVRIPSETLHDIRRGQYVRIESDFDSKKRDFFARISRGPFFVPDAVSKDSAFARAAILHAGKVKFRPDFHGICYAQIMGELDVAQMKTHGTFVRPRPQAAVYPLTGEQIEKLLELSGDMYIGKLDGYSSVRVRIPSDKNAALPRNVGIFGTVGSGKTNTSQVLIEEAAKHNWAVIVLDVEGEYVDMDKPSEQKSLGHLFTEFGVKPEGVRALDVYHPVETEPSRSDSKAFGIRFSNIEPQILVEILGLTQAQTDRFLEIWHNLAQKEYSTKKKTKTSAGFVKSVMEGFEGGPALGIKLDDIIKQIDSILENNEERTNKASYYVLRRKLRRVQRYGIFDSKETLGDYSELLQANKVSVIDFSGSSNFQINNIVITDLLRSIFELKLKDKKKELPNVMIVIEEAHTFVSKDNASRMEETLDVLREISRRGRKRWISLCFISQQPSHLPPEIYELCNTKIAHQTTGGKNLDAIKNSTGGVDPSVWDDVPKLGQGTCLFISSFFKNRPMFCNVRPCMSKRKHVEE